MLREIDIKDIKDDVTEEELSKLSKEELFAFNGSNSYFNTFETGNKILSKDKEIELGKILEQYKMGDDSIKAQVVIAYNELLKYNMVKVYNQVWRFIKSNKGYGYDVENAMQDCLMELHRCILDYDTSKDCGLYTRAHFLVSKKLSVEANKAKPIPITSMGGFKIQKMKEVIEEYERANGIKPNNKYIQEEVKNRYNISISDKEIISLISTHNGMFPLDKRFDIGQEYTGEISDMFGYEDEDYNIIEARDVIDDLTSALDVEDKELLFYYYGISSIYDNFTEKELAKQMGITRRKLKKMAETILSKVQQTTMERGIMLSIS